MPIIVSYFVIPLVLLLLGINIYFRVKMVKQYKFLRQKNIQIDPKIMKDKEKREAYISQHHPEYKEEIQQFSLSMTKLVRYVAIGFLLLLASFLYIYFTQ